jgi:hypothetical protein
MALLTMSEEEKAKLGKANAGLEVMMEIITKPLKGMSTQDIKRAVLEESSLVQKLTAMMYTTCDNWEAMKSPKDEDIQKVHLRYVVVTLMVLDRDRMAKGMEDLKPEQAALLQSKLNQRLAEFREFSMEMTRKVETAKLQNELREATNPDRRKQIQEELAKVPEMVEKLKKEVPKVDVEVYLRDFGDNCYVVNMKGNVNLPEFTFPLTNLNACLRNGNAVVHIGLGGNFTPEQLKKELDHFLSEMDARTAFFRE